MQNGEVAMDGWIGRSPPRVDGWDKIDGTARFVADLRVEGLIDAVAVRSSVARGRIRSIEFDPAFDWSDVTAVTADDIERNQMAVIGLDQPVLAREEIRHHYEPIVLLACARRDKLEAARTRVHVDVDPLAPVLSIEDSLAAREVIFGTDNVMTRYRVRHGNASEALARCEVVVHDVFRVGHQEHMYLEPQGCIAIWDGPNVRVMGSFQCPFFVEKALRHALALPPERIDVTQTVIGGAFGGKEEYPSVIAVHAALLARKAGRPVRILYERREDVQATTKRHPALVDITIGADRDGKLRAYQARIVMDAGAYVTISPVVLSRGLLHSSGAYRWEHVDAEGIAVATNTPPNGAFRGFGAPQTIFAMERQMDRLAARLGMDPLELRKRNLLEVGATLPTGQVLTESVGLGLCVRAAEEQSEYHRKREEWGLQSRKPGDRKLRGIGASVFLHGAGFTGSGEQRLAGKIEVDLLPGGAMRVRTAATEMGQGTFTVLRQIAAESAGIGFDSVEVAVPCTASVPDSGPTVASRTVMIVGNLVAQAAKELASRVREHAQAHGESFAAAADRLLESHGLQTVQKRYEPLPGATFDDATYTGTAYAAYAWACDVAEVEVDLDTFEVEVTRFWSSADVGRAVNPTLCVGQLEGGALQALGYALCEEVQWGPEGIANPTMTTYVVPTARDAPEQRTMLVEDGYAHGPGGAKGIGELPTDGAAPAVAAAIEHATGLSLQRLPMTSETLFDAWRERERKESTAC